MCGDFRLNDYCDYYTGLGYKYTAIVRVHVRACVCVCGVCVCADDFVGLVRKIVHTHDSLLYPGH